MSTNNQPAPNPRRPLLRRADQAAIAAAALVAIVAIGGYWHWQATLRGRMIDIDRSAPRSAEYLVDINSAEWPELIQLPGLGETLAKRIVAWRAAHGAFRSVDNLRVVSGIGPKRLEAWRPYLWASGGMAGDPGSGDRGQGTG